MTTHRELKRQKRARQQRKHQIRKRASLTALPRIIAAEAAFEIGDITTACEEAERAIRIHPRSRDALDILVRGWMLKQRPEVALPYAIRLMEAGKDEPVNYVLLADCLAALGQWVEAREALRRCLSLIPPRPSDAQAELRRVVKEEQKRINNVLRIEKAAMQKLDRSIRQAEKAALGSFGPGSGVTRRSKTGRGSAKRPQLPLDSRGLDITEAPAAGKPQRGAPPPPSTVTHSPQQAVAERKTVVAPLIGEGYTIPMEFTYDEESFDRLRSHLSRPATLEDYRLRLDFARLARQREFDELLCLPTLEGVDFYWHQVETARRVMKSYRGRVLLADEVGLGKTIEAGMVLKEYWLRGMVRKALILVPASLVDQWQEEMAAKFGLDFETTASPLYGRDPESFWKETPLVISSIHQAKSQQNLPKVTAVEYDLVIVDEAHCLRNRRSLNWKLVNAIRKKFLLLLSATPVQNDLLELFNLITVLKPGLLKTERQFRRDYVQSGNPRSPQNEESLRRLLREVMIRNTRSLLALQLPRRFASTVVAAPSAEERELYEGLSRYVARQYKEASSARRFAMQTLMMEAGSSPQALAAGLENFWNRHGDRDGELAEILDRTRDLGTSTKGDRLLEIVGQGTAKTVIFTKYRHTLDALAERCRQAGLSHVVYHGGLNRAQKDRVIESFRTLTRLLLSTELGGEGHNLQFCHTLVNFDLPWNPMKIEQRIGRLQRIGQTRDVFVFNLCQGGSIEESLLRLLDAKLNMFQLVIGEVETILGVLDDEADFHDIVMDLWTQSDSPSERESRFTRFGERLVEARERYLEAKQLDARLFGDD